MLVSKFALNLNNNSYRYTWILVQWILTEACFAVWTMFYDWFWYYGVSRAEISRVPLWHPWAEFFKGKNKMAARYFKVKYVFFQQMKPVTSVIPHFYVILTGQSISCIIFMIKVHLQGQNVNFKVK